MPKFVEDAQLSNVRLTRDGYLVASVLCARTGIQDYLGVEVGRPEIPVVHVYRPESAVFAKDSLATFVGKPTTNDHPPVPVTADNWKQFAVGAIGEEVLREGDYIRVPITLMDASVIKAVQDGKRGISMGYEMDLTWESGQTPDGHAYDAVMSNLKMNHLAIVDRGRAGSRARIGDSDHPKPWGVAPLLLDGKPSMTRKIVLDGITIETTDQGAEALQKLQAQNQILTDAAKTTQAAHDAAIAAKDKELAAKDAEIDALKKTALTDAQLDAKVQARASLISKAQKLAKDADLAGKSDIEIMTVAVTAARGADAVTGKSPAYIEAAFDLAVDAQPDQFRQDMQGRDKQSANDNGQSGYEKRLNDAWKGGAK
jgi:hypothetical protein